MLEALFPISMTAAGGEQNSYPRKTIDLLYGVNRKDIVAIGVGKVSGIFDPLCRKGMSRPFTGNIKL